MIKIKRHEMILSKIKNKNPIVFHITNTVTINDCANITLSVGASPLMSFCKEELDDILSFSSALVLNIGTMDIALRQNALSACKKANEKNVPIVLDPVGVGASSERKKLVQTLLENAKFAVIKGNSAEINTIAGFKNEHNRGVDSHEDIKNPQELVKNLASKLNCTIAMSGAIDVVSDGEKVALISNGTKELSRVTGTGCMCASLIGSACGAGESGFESAVFGLSLMGMSAEKFCGAGKSGNGSLRVALLDGVYNMDESLFEKMSKIEYI